jgi:flavin-dependent dehydrogenase
MTGSQYDVIVIGGGCAGLTAAIGLARAGFCTAVIEAAVMPGSGGELGGVCFAENLAQPDLLGSEGVEGLAWERRLVERGSFVTDGRRLVGSTYRDPEAFRHCYTILRPLFVNHLAQIARMHGVTLLTETIAEALIRDGRRIIGVSTSRGALYSALVFLAEGDAGHFLSREGLDRTSDPRDAPAFLYGLQQVLDLPPGAIEDCFGVGPEQGVAHDLLLRNPGGARLNIRGFVCTNRQSVLLSLLLPVTSLNTHFGGQPRQLLEWFADMPALRPWWREGRPGAWTAHLLRTGGLRDVPYLVEDGLAVGGAAAGLGLDFPVLNSTGPATATGLLISRGAAAIRAEGGGFRSEELVRHYLQPLQQTRYWRDMEFLQRWPGYVRRTCVLFDQELDLLLDSSAVWARPRRWLPRKLLGWFRVLGRVRWTQWAELQADLKAVGHALRLRQVLPRPTLARLVLDGALNAFRDLVRKPRAHLPPGGTLRVHYSAEDGMAGMAPTLLRRWFERFRPVLGSAGHILYRNNDMPLSAKLTAMIELLVRQLNVLDLLALAGLGFLTALASTLLGAFGAVGARLFRSGAVSGPAATEMPDIPRQESESEPAPPAQILVVWRSALPAQRAEAVRRLPHVCPAGVFEVHGGPPGPVRVMVEAAKCIACEACWRTNPSVDWTRDGPLPPLAPVLSPVVTRLLAAEDRAGLTPPVPPKHLDYWPRDLPGPDESSSAIRLSPLLDRLENKLVEFDRVLALGPPTIDRSRGDHLEMLARYAHQLAVVVHDALRESVSWNGGTPMRRRMLELASALVIGTDQRTRRVWDGHYGWAAADGRLLRYHHLLHLRSALALETLASPQILPPPVSDLLAGGVSSWPPTDAHDACIKHLLVDIAAHRYVLVTLNDSPEAGDPPDQAELLSALAKEIHTRQEIRSQSFRDSRIRLELLTIPAAAASGYRHFGEFYLLEAERSSSLLNVRGDWTTLLQRRALLAEQQEVQEAEARLFALACDWRAARHEPTEDAAITAGFGRQVAHMLAGKRLLLSTHARLEEGHDTELAIVLLRVWLDHAATLLDEFTIAVRDRLRPPALHEDRPLVDPGSGPPLTTLQEYQQAAGTHAPGDFLLVPVDLRQPRLVPEMVGRDDMLTAASRVTSSPADLAEKPTAPPPVTDEILAELLSLRNAIRAHPPDVYRRDEALFLAEALVLDTIGCRLCSPAQNWPLEVACCRLILTDLRQPGSDLRSRCEILLALAETVLPRCLRLEPTSGVHHLGREVLEVEALKAESRRRLLAAGQVFGEALGRNPDVQASCFALAEATAWIKAADSTLGRMAWLHRLQETEEGQESSTGLETGRRVLAHCHAKVRDRLFRFDEDLAALRRGYYAPPVRAAALLLRPELEHPSPPPASDIRRPLRVLVIVEPGPAESARRVDGDSQVLEALWVLSGADRAALENALRLRDAAPELVALEVAAFGPPRVGPSLRELLSLGIENVRLVVPDHKKATPDRVAAALADSLAVGEPFDLILGGFHPGDRLTVLLAEILGVPAIGHAAAVSVQAGIAKERVRLTTTAGPRERPLPAAVLVEAGTPMRSYTIAGYLAGLRQQIQILSV